MTNSIHLPGLNGLRAIAAVYLITTSATLLLAWLSYRYFESPFLRMKSRFSIVQSQNTMR